MKSTMMSSPLLVNSLLEWAGTLFPMSQSSPCSLTGPATASELPPFLERQFPRWHVPDSFVFVNELAHTSTGKLLKSKLRQDFGHLGEFS